MLLVNTFLAILTRRLDPEPRWRKLVQQNKDFYLKLKRSWLLKEVSKDQSSKSIVVKKKHLYSTQKIKNISLCLKFKIISIFLHSALKKTLEPIFCNL